jgi:hypothetical protein
MYQILKDTYNDTISELQIGKRKRQETNRASIKKNKRNEHEFINALTAEDAVKTRSFPTLESTVRFKKFNTEMKYVNPDPVDPGYESLRIFNHSIPQLIKSLKETQGMKVVYTIGLQFSRTKATVNEQGIQLDVGDQSEIPHISKPEIITSQSEIKPFIENLKTYIQNYIPELEAKGSGLHFDFCKYVILHVMTYNPLQIKSYLPLPSDISNKKCCVNIKNENDKCIMYCVLFHIFQKDIEVNPERVSKYTPYLNVYDWSKIKFPVALKDIGKVEDLVGHAINVYDCGKRPLRISEKIFGDDKIINLLIIGDHIKDAQVMHYVYIKKMDVFVMKKQRNADGKHVSEKSFVCERCLHPFSSKARCEKHKADGCDMFMPTRTEMPKFKKVGDKFVKPTIKFEHHNRKFDSPVRIYADFETLIQSTGEVHDDTKSSTTKLAILPACSYSFNIVSQYPELNFGLELYRGKEGDDVTVKFLSSLIEYGDKIRKILNTIKEMIITPKQEKEFQAATCCHICNGAFDEENFKVRDHDHINGLYRGCAHQSCNLNLSHKNFLIPVFFHNLKGFDGHLIIQGLRKLNFSKIRIIAQNFEKYMTFSFGQFRFLDSFAFMASSLDTLSGNLLKDGKHNFKHTLNNSYSEEQNDLLLRKGVYPYEYINSYDKFEETSLPFIDKFYSRLGECYMTAPEFKHALKVWKKFGLKTMGEYHDLYLKTDVLLLTDVFETFRKLQMKNYQLDPANGYFTLPNYAWDAMLLKTEVELDQLTAVDMYIMCEQGIRGGTSMISHRYAQANNKYLSDYDKDKISSYIVYLDANNLYGGAMCNKLPKGNFKWVKYFNADLKKYVCDSNVPIDEEYIQNYDTDGDRGIFVECDLHYPKELHDHHNNYPLAVESKSILSSELSPYQLNQMSTHDEKHNEKMKKLVPNLYDKTKYIVHIKNLQYYLKKGLVLKKIHRVLEFDQSAWMKTYIDFNTNERKKSKNDFEKDLYKLMNNAPFGKTMENMRGRVDIQLYTDEKLVEKQVAKPQYLQSKIYSEDLIAIKSVPKVVTLCKPIYAGLAILDLSKLHMYQFHYDFIKEKYEDKATLLFTDTDSLTYHIETEDLYKDMKDNSELFDFSDYCGTGYRSKDESNKKVVGKFKDETEGIPIKEFIGLRSKMYSVLLDNGKEKKTGKGIKKSAMKAYIKHADYKRCLLSNDTKDQRQLISFNNLRTQDHNIGMYRFTKVGLSCSNDKQYLLEDGITSLSYGHYKIAETLGEATAI